MNEPIENKTASRIAVLAEALESQRLTINALDDGSGVVLDVDGEQLLTMNATALTLVQAVSDGARTEGELVTVLTDTFEVDDDPARADIRSLMKQVTEVL